MFPLSRSESVALLTRSQVGRVVFTARALPAVTPVPFAFLGDEIIMHSSGDTRLAEAAMQGSVLAFEVDDIDPASRTGWSVVVVGEPQLVTSAPDLAHVDRVLAAWAPGRHDVCIRLPLTAVTGRRISASEVPMASSRDQRATTEREPG